MTSFAGLPLLLEMAHHPGVTSEVNNIPGLQERKRKHAPSDYLMSLMLMLVSDGNPVANYRELSS